LQLMQLLHYINIYDSCIKAVNSLFSYTTELAYLRF
jgi:hypothetical protein